MIEAEITCVCSPGIRIADLNLNLTKGDVVYVPEAQARASMDLRRARAGVHLRMVQRCRERRAPPRAPRRPPEARPQAPVMPPEAPVPQPYVPDLEGTVSKLLTPLVEEVAALRRETQQRATAAPQGAPAAGMVDPTTPMFIPNDLADAGLKGEITSKSEKKSGESLDAASAALRALKGKRHG